MPFAVNHLIGFGARRSQWSNDFVLSDSLTGTGQNPSWSGVNIGAADADREIVVTLAVVSAADVTGPTLSINGNAMAAHGTVLNGIGGSFRRDQSRVFKLAVPSGTTATIAVSDGASTTSTGWSLKVYRGVGPFYRDHFAAVQGVDAAMSLAAVGGGFTFAVCTNGNQSQDTALSGIGGTANNIDVSTYLRASHGYEAFADGIQTVTAPSVDTGLVRTFRRDMPPLAIALVTADTSHAAATNTKTALEAFEHTVTLVDDADIGTTDFSSYDVIVAARVTGATTSADSTVASGLQTLLDGGKPIVMGATTMGMTAGTGRSTLATLLNLTGTWRIMGSTDGGTEIAITSTAHAITDGFSVATVPVYSAANFMATLTAGQSFVGTSLADGDPDESGAGEDAIIAIEAGTNDLTATPTGARAVVGDFPYAGQDTMAARGQTLLNRMCQWAAGNIG